MYNYCNNYIETSLQINTNKNVSRNDHFTNNTPYYYVNCNKNNNNSNNENINSLNNKNYPNNNISNNCISGIIVVTMVVFIIELYDGITIPCTMVWSLNHISGRTLLHVASYSDHR